jgi:hypothetical protein
LTIDARLAVFSQITLRNVTGVAITGGRVFGNTNQTVALTIDSSSSVTISGMIISGSRVGVGIVRSSQVRILGNDLNGLRHDGVNITMSRSIIIDGNTCRNFRPVLAQYAADGRLLVDGDHPECVQGWSTRGHPPTSDITVINNVASGYMQGIFFGNPGQGGYDRLRIEFNRLELSTYNAIVVQEGRRSTVRNNTVTTVRGARMPSFPFNTVFAWIKLSGKELVGCGNNVSFPQYSDGTEPCR